MSTLNKNQLTTSVYFELLDIPKDDFRLILDSIKFYSSYFLRTGGSIDLKVLDNFRVPSINTLPQRIILINLVKLFLETNLFTIIQDLVNDYNSWITEKRLSSNQLITVLSLPDALVEKSLLKLSEDPIILKKILNVFNIAHVQKEAP